MEKYYYIDRDETAFGGEIVRVAEFSTWGEARKAWKEMEPDTARDVVLWLARGYRNHEDYGETLDAKPPEAHPFHPSNFRDMFRENDLKKIDKKFKEAKGLGGPSIDLSKLKIKRK
jgi:hypothetical protein